MSEDKYAKVQPLTGGDFRRCTFSCPSWRDGPEPHCEWNLCPTRSMSICLPAIAQMQDENAQLRAESLKQAAQVERMRDERDTLQRERDRLVEALDQLNPRLLRANPLTQADSDLYVGVDAGGNLHAHYNGGVYTGASLKEVLLLVLEDHDDTLDLEEIKRLAEAADPLLPKDIGYNIRGHYDVDEPVVQFVSYLTPARVQQLIGMARERDEALARIVTLEAELSYDRNAMNEIMHAEIEVRRKAEARIEKALAVLEAFETGTTYEERQQIDRALAALKGDN